MKVLNICKFLPIKGLVSENDITLKIYSDLKSAYNIESIFVYPCFYIPKFLSDLTTGVRRNYQIVTNKAYTDEKYNIKIRFFRSFIPLKGLYSSLEKSMWAFRIQFVFHQKDLYNLYKDYKPDIIHAHNITDGFYAYKLYKKYGTPYIITLRGVYSYVYEKKWVTKILENAQNLSTPSYSMHGNVKKHHEISLIPHGLDDFWFKDVVEKKVLPSKLRIVTVARLLSLKNIDIILDALNSLKNENNSFNFDIIGEGPEEERLKYLVNEYGLASYVHFHGFLNQDDVRSVLDKNDIFILLSERETFGRVYFEAAARNLLIIGSKGTGADGYFSSKEALFINPNKLELLEVLNSIDCEKFCRMTKLSLEKIRSFKTKIITEKYYSLFNEKVINV
ncbi:glycosyltransferase family 4 protein [Lutimonas vermicola]|uniref:Glycosyltransferase family 4 protein n=1 Tax=Lutimonas vermicola TaxID=414288 RepID=A0ABU9L059_9FLAO